MLELVRNPQGEIVDKRPVEFELKRWKRGIMLSESKRNQKGLYPLKDGLFEIPWSDSQYMLPAPPKVVTKPENPYQKRLVEVEKELAAMKRAKRRTPQTKR